MGQDVVIYLGIWENCASNSNMDWSKVVIKLSQRSEINILRLSWSNFRASIPGLKLESPPASGTAGLMQTWDSKCKLQEGPCVDQVCPRLPISMKKTLLTGLWEVDMQINIAKRTWNCGSNLQALNIAVWTLWTRDSKQHEICNTRFLVQC